MGEADITTLKQCMCMVAALVAGTLASGAAIASPMTFVMGFDDLPSAQYGEYVDDWYNGGCGGSYVGGLVDCGGPNYGAIWTGALAGGAPNGIWHLASGQPSGPNIMGLQTGRGTLNVPSGFQDFLRFAYSAPSASGSVTVYSGRDGTGTPLATGSLPSTSGRCDQGSGIDCWGVFSLAFNGTASSVVFESSGQAATIGFDDVTFTVNATTVPEPATIAMLGFGLLLLGGLAGARRRARRR